MNTVLRCHKHKTRGIKVGNKVHTIVLFLTSALLSRNVIITNLNLFKFNLYFQLRIFSCSKWLKMSNRSARRVPVYQEKRWRESPPCEQQKFLERLFASGEITDIDTPNVIKQKYPIFHEFSSRVFAVHFRKLKAKYGGMCK